MQEISLETSFFINNRKKLAASMEKGAAMILSANILMQKSADQFFPFRQESNFFYLTGICSEDLVFCFFPQHPDKHKREIILLPQQDERSLIYDGEKLNPIKVEKISGIQQTEKVDKLTAILQDYAEHCSCLYLLFDDKEESKHFIHPNQLLYQRLTKDKSFQEIKNAKDIIHPLRYVKNPEEIQQIKKAIAITANCFDTILRLDKNNRFEHEIEALMHYEFIRNGGQGAAFQSIVASGENACVLHYTENAKKMKAGDLVLLDFGADYNYYAADVSRSIPVSGKFSKRQKEIYNEVLAIQKKTIDFLEYGKSINDINKYVAKLMEESLLKLDLLSLNDIKKQNPEMPAYKKYYPHGTCHFLGIDVHDVGSRETPLQEGMIITVEPGIYIPEEKIGIRIENDILISNPVIDLTASIPREIEELEEIMLSNK
jgi:Xaa-Pro aminopeptidase